MKKRLFVYLLFFLLLHGTAVAATIGGQIFTSADDTGSYSLCTDSTATASGDANPGTAYIYGNTDSGTASVYIGVYVFNASGPWDQTRLAISSAITLTTTPGWSSAAITWTGITNTTHYIICAWSNTATVNVNFEAGGNGWYQAASYALPPDPFVENTGGDWDNTVAGYIEYSTGEAATPRRRILLF